MYASFEQWWKTVSNDVADKVGSGDVYAVVKQAAYDAWEKAFVIGRTAGWKDGYGDGYEEGEGITW
jgi:hypothetical protein